MGIARVRKAKRLIVVGIFGLITAVPIVVLLGGAVWADEEGKLEAERSERTATHEEADPSLPKGWYPSLSIGFDLQFGVASSIFSSDSVPTLGVTADYPVTITPPGVYPFCGAPTGANACPAGERSYGSPFAEASISSAMITLQGELVAPVLSEELGDMRPFLAVRGQVPTRTNYTIYSYTGTFEPVNATFWGPGRPNPQIVTRAAFAAASSVKTSVAELGNWFLGIGLDFTLPFPGRRPVSVRPSIHYFGARIEYEVDYTSKEFPNPADPFPNFGEGDNGVPVMRLSGGNPMTLHGIAPRVAFDVLLTRQGPLAFSLYTEYQALVFLSGRELRIEVPNEIGTGTARLDFSMEQVQHQMGFGLRISWVGWGASGSD